MPYPDLFNDVFGPVMQPGSSSHTAGPCRLGRAAGDLLGEAPGRIHVLLDESGSFAGTFGLMAEDRAMVAGVLGMEPGDERIFSAFEHAAAVGAEVAFEFGVLTESDHPNAIKFTLTAPGGRTVSLVGASTGGGMIETVEVDGFPFRTTGDTFVLLVFDRSPDAADGVDDDVARVSARLPDLVSRERVPVAGQGVLHAFRCSSEPDLGEVTTLLATGAPAVRVALLRPLLPVVTRAERGPQLFDTMTRWRDLARERGRRLWEVVVEYEMHASGWSADEVVGRMRALMGLMHRQTRAAYEPGASVPTSPFKPDFTARWAAHHASASRLTDDLTASTIRWAYGAGAGIPGVPTVPGPMGGGGGYVYAALSAVKEARGLSDEDLLHGLFVAGGIGIIAFSRTEPTGEVLGCTGESGICGAMAAAGIVEMVGGDPQRAEDAASLALQATIGLPCDPIPGGLSQPCRSRVLQATVMAHVFADLAIAGHSAVLPLHEAIDVADAVGRSLAPGLLCTSEGGACATPTARRCRAAFSRWIDETRPRDRPPGNLI